MEVANLQVVVSSEVADALAGLRSVQREVKDVASVSDIELKKMGTATKTTGSGVLEETKKIEGFLSKWKMGWIAVGAAAIASLYAVAKSSAVIRGYFSEFGMIIGSVFDEIGVSMAPVIDPLLDFLWKVGDLFVSLPGPVKLATGVIIGAATGFLGLVSAIAAVKAIFAAAGLASIFASIKATLIPLIAGIKAFFASLLAGAGLAATFATIATLVLGGLVIWKLYTSGVTKALGNVIDEFGKAHPIFSDFFMAVTAPLQALGAIAVLVMEGELKQIPGELKRIFGEALVHWRAFKTSTEAILASYDAAIRTELDRLVAGIGDIGSRVWAGIASTIGTVQTELDTWAATFYGPGYALVESLLKGIGDIGARIWTWSQRKIGTVMTELTRWTSLFTTPGGELVMRFITGIGDIGARIWSHIRSKLPTVDSSLRDWARTAYNAGAELVSSFIRGIGDIGSRIMGHIRSGLSYVSSELGSWALGTLSFSPTLLEIGKQIPLTLVQGAGEVALDSRTFAPVVAPAVKPIAYPETFAPSTAGGSPATTEININMPVTITAAIRSETDLRDLARKLKEELKRELKDYVRS